MIEYRKMEPDELYCLHHIDRSDSSSRIYRVEGGRLVLVDFNFRHVGFSPEQWMEMAEEFREEVLGGRKVLFGAWDDGELSGVSGLETATWYGRNGDMLNMGPLWVSVPWRFRGVGRRLLEMTMEVGRELGARALYVSATPVPATVRFYLSAGCRLMNEPDEILYTLEPEDIHLELHLEKEDPGNQDL